MINRLVASGTGQYRGQPQQLPRFISRDEWLRDRQNAVDTMFDNKLAEFNKMTIHDKHAFEDAQIMARAAIEMTERWWKEAYWRGAMLSLKAAYKVK